MPPRAQTFRYLEHERSLRASLVKVPQRQAIASSDNPDPIHADMGGVRWHIIAHGSASSGSSSGAGVASSFGYSYSRFDLSHIRTPKMGGTNDMAPSTLV